MAINPNINTSLFIVSPELQEPMIDKDTATAMAGGIVTFFQDSARTVLKNVFVQTGAPGSYTYAALPNPMVLTVAGTPADAGGNDAIIYWYPFDENNPDISQPYYVTVVNANLVPQFTRSNWPYINASEEPNNNSQLIPNFISNGQFLAHNNIPGNLYPNGNIVAVSTIRGTPTNVGGIVIAPGGSGGPGNVAGWQFQKPTDNNDTDSITFVNEVTAAGSTLSGNPVYALELTCSNIGTTHDGPKQLVYPFYNVNLFSSETQYYTFACQGQSLNTAPLAVTFEIYQYFGPNGTAPVTTAVPGGNFQFGFGTWNWSEVSFLFPSTAGMTIDNSDPNNPPYVALVLKFPNGTGQVYNVLLDNFVLTPGVLQISSYPEVPANSDVSTGIAGALPVPNPNGSDLFLPIIYTATGFAYDTSMIGNPVPSFSNTVPKGYLLANGAAYQNGLTSSDGIPYSRLFNVYWNGGAYNNVPQFGTGVNYVTAYNPTGASGAIVTISQNKAVNATGPTDGAVPTTFTFNVGANSVISPLDFTASRQGATGIFIRCQNTNNAVVATHAGAGTSGFTVSDSALANGINHIVSVTGITAGSTLVTGSAGLYFTFYDQTTTTGYYIWYNTGTETDPAPGGSTGIQVNVTSTDTAADVAYKTILRVNGFYFTNITTKAAGSITGGSYFTFTAGSTGSTAYYVWYQVNGVGTDPAPGGTGIKVTLAGAETAAVVATDTLVAVNSLFFAVPALNNGTFLRGNDTTHALDYQSALRGGFGNNAWYGAQPGTFEFDQFQASQLANAGNAAGAGSFLCRSAGSTGDAQPGWGGAETRPVNVSVNWLVHY